MKPDQSQQAAIDKITNSSSRISILTGGPGRGKSACISWIIQRAWDTNQATPYSTYIAASTGKAAKVIDAELDVDVAHRPSTIHRLLGCKGIKWEFNPEYKLEAELLILDEVSMVDSVLMARILNSVSGDCKIVLTGDRHQLNPIGPGAPFFDLVEYGPPEITSKLKINWRQRQGSLIADACDRILNRQTVSFGSKGGHVLTDAREDDLFWIEEECSDKIIDRILPIVYPWYEKRLDYACLSPQRTGVVGLDLLNKQMQGCLNPWARSKPEIKVFDTVFRVGDKIRVTKNNYRLDIFNGYIGWIESIDSASKSMILDFDGQRVTMVEHADLKELTLAYVQTVHSVQGSGYDLGVFICDSRHHYMLSNQLVYVAFSRFKEGLHVVGQKEMFNKSMKNKRKNMRDTLLKLKMTEKLEE